MERREFLLALAALGLAAPLGPALGQTPPRNSQRRFIDAHCHFFNAKDLPVRGFIRHVVLRDYEELKALPAERSLRLLESVWKGLASLLVKTILGAGTPDPREEMQCLTNPSVCDDFAPRLRSSRALSATVSDDDRKAHASRLLRFALEEHYASSRSLGEGSARALQQDADIDAFIGEVMSEMKQKGRLQPDANPQRLRTDRLASPRFLLDIADFITGGDSAFSRYFRWAELLTSYRSQIVAKYVSLYQTAERRLALATPALVDYNYWLGDQSPADLREQAKLMGLLSLRQPMPVHALVPFDPLRNLRREPGQPSSLAIVQEAIAKHGFIGVKLYSPMGFRPFGNVEETLYPPDLSRDDPAFGRKLDGELLDLYEWCAQEEVAILAHTADSQAANTDFAKRANPKFWIPVLEKHNRLRVNLAHFGNFQQARTRSGFDLSLYPQTWEAQISEMMANPAFPNVYADLSYFTWIVGKDSLEQEHISQVKKLFARFLASGPSLDRLVFGTDWSMMAREDKFEAYLDNLEAFFRDLGLDDKAIDNLFYGNALRFYGLESDTKTFTRIKSFYEENGKQTPTFGRADAQ